MDKGKRYKKGEYLFKEGDLTSKLFVIERGRIALTIERNGKKIEIATMNKTQILGEQSVFSNARQSFNAEAMQESVVMEVPVDVIKTQFAEAPAGVKLIMKSLVDEVKLGRQTLKSIKMAQDSSPCPQISIPRLFCILNLVTRHTGQLVEAPQLVPQQNEDREQDGEQAPTPEAPPKYKVDFGILKLYTTRSFAESPQRLKNTVELLSKLGMLEMFHMKNDDGEEELDHLIVKDLQGIEDFAEFYQFNLYKGAKSEVIYVDQLAYKVSNALVDLSADAQPDHKGAVSIDYDYVLKTLKNKYKIDLKSTHLDVLEKKGLFVERKPRGEEGTDLKFDKAEFQRINKFWKIIVEIDKWNEQGYVDLNEKQDLSADESASGCPQCQGEVLEEHKFCPHCGFNMAA